jgi:hypothetical protein
VTGDKLVVYTDPAVPDGFGYVSVGEAEPGVVWIKNEAGEVTRGRVPYLDPLRFADLATQYRSRGLAPDPLRMTLPLQRPTLDMFTKAVGKAATQVRLFADILSAALGRDRRRVVRPVPPIVPPGLSRVDSARARSSRSALLRSRRRAIRHNRALPRPRARIRITAFDPKITWDESKSRPEDRQNDRVDAALYAFAATPRKD